MFQQVDDPGETPGRDQEFLGKQADRYVASGDKVVPQDQEGEQKIGRGQSDEPYQGEYVITERILAGGGIEADGDRQCIGKKEGCDRDGETPWQTGGDQFGDGLVPFQRTAQVALQNVAQPAEITHVGGRIQPVPQAQRIDLRRVNGFLLLQELIHIGVHEISRRRFDDDEGDNGNDEQGGDHQQDAAHDKGQHVRE